MRYDAMKKAVVILIVGLVILALVAPLFAGY